MESRSMSVKVLVLLSVCLAVISLFAAESVNPSKISPSIAQVVKMHEAGVAPDVLLAYVNETPISKPSAEEVLYLTEKGIPKEVILAMLTKRVWADNTPAQSQPAPEPVQPQNQSQLPPAVTTSQAVTQTVVHVQQPAPVAYVAPPYYSYYPYYYPYYPRVSVGVGFGYGWYGGHHWGGHHHHGHHHGGHHHGGGIRVHRR